MAFTPVAVTDLSTIAQFNQIMAAWEGDAGAGNPMLLTKYEGVDYVADIMQNDSIYCKMMRVVAGGAQRFEASGRGPALGTTETPAQMQAVSVGQNMTTLDTFTVDGVDLSAHIHAGGASGAPVKHSSLSGLVAPADDHTQYFNAARHTAAEHEPPIMNLDAGALGGLGPTAFPPWADFRLSKTAQTATGWDMPNVANTWADVGAMSLTIAPSAITDFHALCTACIEAKASDYNGNWHFRVSCAKTGGETVYSEEVVSKATDVADSVMFAVSFQGLEPGTYTVKVQFKRTVYEAARQILVRRFSVVALPSTPTVDEPTGDFFISIPSQTYLMGDTASVTVQYAPNTQVWLMVNGELSSVVRGTTNSSGVATLAMPIAAPHFVAGSGSASGSSPVPMLAVMSVWTGGGLRIAHGYIAVGSGTRTALANIVVAAGSVTGKLQRSTGEAIGGAKVYGWGDNGEVSAVTHATLGTFTLAVDNCKYVVFKGYTSGLSYAGCVHNVAPKFNVPYTRITDKPIGMWNRGDGPYDAGKYLFYQWDQINNNNGSYDWAQIDADIALAAAGGYKLGIGIGFYWAQPDKSPYHKCTIPTWIGSGRQYLMSSGGAQAYLPAYNAAAFQNAFTTMVAAFGVKYNGNANVAFVMCGPGIDNESVITKDAGGILWQTSKIYQNYGVTDNIYETFKAAAYDAFVAAFPATPIIWHGKRPNTRFTYQMAHDGVLFKTNGYTEKGAVLSYGASGSEGCLDMLEGLVPSGCESKSGAGYMGSEFTGPLQFVTRDLSGHFYEVAALLQHGNRLITAHPEYWCAPLLGQSQYQNWFLRSLTKQNWWIILREIPAVDDVTGATLSLPSNGLCIQRGPLGFRMAAAGGTMVTRAEWLSSNVPRTTETMAGIGDVISLRDTLFDCRPIESNSRYEEAPVAWNGKFPRMGRKGTVTLHLLGAADGTYSGTFGFYGLGGFSIGGVAVPAVETAAMQLVEVSNFAISGGSVSIALDTDYLVFAHVWRVS